MTEKLVFCHRHGRYVSPDKIAQFKPRPVCKTCAERIAKLAKKC